MTISTWMRSAFLLLFIMLLGAINCEEESKKEKRKQEEEAIHRLSWKIKEGDITSYIANIEIFLLFENDKIQGKPKMIYTIPYLLKVARWGEKEIEWEVQFGNLEFETNIPSAVPPDKTAIKRSTGKIRTDVYGKVLSLSGFEALGLPGKAILPGSPIIVFPKQEIRIGETWNDESRYRLDKIEDGKVLISYENDDSKASGKIWLDANTGTLIRLEDTRKLKNEVEMEIKTTIEKQ